MGSRRLHHNFNLLNEAVMKKSVKHIGSGLLNAVLACAIVFTAQAAVQAQEQQLLHEESQKQHLCLAMNIYYESRGSNLADQAAVADVVLNRVVSTKYPNTICEVVHQGKQRPSWKDPNVMVMVRHMCQFSWYCDGKADNPQDEDAWADAQMLAYYMIEYDQYRGISEGATHYHATYVNPSWNRNMQLVGRIGSHVFYRTK